VRGVPHARPVDRVGRGALKNPVLSEIYKFDFTKEPCS
jgi:hypothetical protein